MTPTKTLQDRERELQTMLSTQPGRTALEQMASRYQASSARPMPERTSIITYILVHERGEGMIAN